MAFFGRIAAAGFCFSAFLAAGQTPQPAAEWLPDGAIATFQAEHPAALLDLAASFELPDMLLGGSGDKGFQQLVDMLSQRAGIGSGREGLIRNLAGNGILFAVYPGDSTVLVLDAKDGVVLDAL